MKCLSEQTIWEYLDDELDASDEKRVRSHIKKCPCCQKQLQEIEMLNASFTEAVASKECFFKKNINKALEHCEGQVLYHQIHDRRSFFLTIFTTLVLLSTFAALAFIAIVVPDIKALPFSGEFSYLKSILIKFTEFLLSSTAIIGLIFFVLFVYNYISSRIFT